MLNTGKKKDGLVISVLGKNNEATHMKKIKLAILGLSIFTLGMITACSSEKYVTTIKVNPVDSSTDNPT